MLPFTPVNKCAKVDKNRGVFLQLFNTGFCMKKSLSVCFFFKVGTPIYDQGKMLDEEFERLVQKFLPCYFDVLDELESRTDTPNSDASDGGPGEKKKKKRYEDDDLLHIH